ncbi:MAG: hypothetical protein M1588_00030, partial [Planctomycetes bacterium]|nr:hypothetical protein [Planctomycetota bacterium]
MLAIIIGRRMENFDTAQLRQWDQQYLWHPFTPMKAWRQKPDAPVIVRGQDEFLFDSDGQRYIDGRGAVDDTALDRRRRHDMLRQQVLARGVRNPHVIRAMA